MNITNNSDHLSEALIKFNYLEPSNVDLAKHIGFNDDEINRLKMFWEPTFNKGWIYLSPKMILDMGYKLVSKFYAENLRPNYIENIEYKEVDENNELIKFYVRNLSVPLGTLKIVPHKRGTPQKYYIISGNTYKKMLMRCRTKKGNDLCNYYIKVEELAIFMKDYITELHKYLLKIKETENDLLKNRVDKMTSFVNDTKPLIKNSTIYIATSKIYASQNKFKIGNIEGIGNKKLKQRLSTYNTGRTDDDLFYFCYTEKVYCAMDIDYRLKKILSHFKYNKNKEMVILHYDALMKIIKIITDNHMMESDYINIFLQKEYQSYIDRPIIIPSEINITEYRQITLIDNIDGSEIRRLTVDVSALSDTDILQKLKEMFNEYMRTTYDNPTFDCDNDKIKNAIVHWTDIREMLMDSLGIDKPYKLKANIWKNKLKRVAEQTDTKVKWQKCI